MPVDVQTRLRGTRWGHIAQEFFTNSFHFPIANILLELLIEDLATFFSKPDIYALTIASLIQAYSLGSWQYAGRPRPLLGNLIGPALYTAVEASIEGIGYFFSNPIHLAYWGFAFAIGWLQQIRLRASGKSSNILVLLENVVRAGILLAGYWIFEALTEPRFAFVQGFLADNSHVFVILVILLTGLVVGFAQITAQSYLTMLRETAAQLRLYSEWLLGRELLSRAVGDPATLALQRRERTVLFMDIRGFTRWSEAQSPEKVVAMLNAYFETAERVWSKYRVIKTKLTADEVMIVFPDEPIAARAALELRGEIAKLLDTHQLAAGIGLHSGPLVEGLLGSKDVKGYDVMGDTVNTAKRICDAAKGGEILLSQRVYAALDQPATILETRQITVKGKGEPLDVYSLRGLGGPVTGGHQNTSA